MSEEVRTSAEPSSDPRTGSFVHPEFAELWHAEPDRSIPWKVVSVVSAIFVFATGVVWMM